MIERLGARATALAAVAALCASLAFAFAAAALGGSTDGGDEVATADRPVAAPAAAPAPSTTLPVATAPTEAPAASEPATTTSTAPPTTVPPPPTTAAPLPPAPLTPAPLAPAAPTADGTPVPHATRVFVFGDSVILGAKSVLPQRLGGWEVVVDAAESRFEHEAPGILRARRADIGRVAVILIGHNSGPGYDHETWIRRMMDELAGVERVVFLTAVEWGPGPAEFNVTLRRVAPEYPSIVVADWNALSAANPSYTFDGLHLLGPGQAAMADLIASAVGPPPT